MKSEARIFLGVAVFCWLAATAYGVWTEFMRLAVEPRLDNEANR